MLVQQIHQLKQIQIMNLMQQKTIAIKHQMLVQQIHRPKQIQIMNLM